MTVYVPFCALELYTRYAATAPPGSVVADHFTVIARLGGPGVAATPVTALGGGPADLHDFKSQAILVVNTASQCGLTPQYAGLQRLQDRYAGRGFTVSTISTSTFSARWARAGRDQAQAKTPRCAAADSA